MRFLVVLVLSCSLAVAEPVIPLDPNPREDLFHVESPNQDKLPQCLVVNKNPDAWLYATAGAVVVSLVWGFFYYNKNK